MINIIMNRINGFSLLRSCRFANSFSLVECTGPCLVQKDSRRGGYLCSYDPNIMLSNTATHLFEWNSPRTNHSIRTNHIFCSRVFSNL